MNCVIGCVVGLVLLWPSVSPRPGARIGSPQDPAYTSTLAAALGTVILREARASSVVPIVAVLGPDTLANRMARELGRIARFVPSAVVDTSRNFKHLEFSKKLPVALKIAASGMDVDSVIWVTVRRCAGWPCRTEYSTRVSQSIGGFVVKRLSSARRE